MIAIPLRTRDGSIAAHAQVDDADEWAAALRWHLNRRGYVVRSEWFGAEREKCRTLYLHREILAKIGHASADEGDHINRIKLDCRRANLRPADRTLNNQNRTSMNPLGRGVIQVPSGRYRAIATVNGDRRHIGIFDSASEAAQAAAAFRAEHMPGSIEYLQRGVDRMDGLTKEIVAARAGLPVLPDIDPLTIHSVSVTEGAESDADPPSPPSGVASDSLFDNGAYASRPDYRDEQAA